MPFMSNLCLPLPPKCGAKSGRQPFGVLRGKRPKARAVAVAGRLHRGARKQAARAGPAAVLHTD